MAVSNSLFPNGKSKPITLSVIAMACLGYLGELRYQLDKIEDKLVDIEKRFDGFEQERKIEKILKEHDRHGSIPARLQSGN